MAISTPQLSVVTPSLNQAGFLSQCLQSVAQLQPEVEHIVMDGASTDGSVPLLEQHAKSCSSDRFRYHSEQDLGLYHAVNRGVTRASADIVTYLGCDDALLPWTPRLVLEAFERRPEIDWIVGDALELEGDRAAFVIQPPPWALEQHFKAGFLLPQPAVFFRRALFDRLEGFDQDYRLIADHDFFVRALLSGARPLRLWECLAVQRVVPGQLMQQHAREARAEHQRIAARQAWQNPPRCKPLRHRVGPAFLHRIALVRHTLKLPLRAWEQLSRSGYLQVNSFIALCRVMLRSSAGRRFLELSERGRRELSLEISR